MKLTNVRLIFAREIRDQLRDRRTLFMIFVLPVLLYPLLGIAMSQMQFRRDQAASVLVVGSPDLADRPYLFENEQFSPGLFGDAAEAAHLQLTFAPPSPAAVAEGGTLAGDDPRDRARQAVEGGQYDAALFFPPDFAGQLHAFRQATQDQGRRIAAKKSDGLQPMDRQVPLPAVFCNKAKERSVLASARVRDVLDSWAREVGQKNLADAGLPATAARPFTAEVVDVTEGVVTGARADIWSKLLPVLLLVWALTGAFYPAVDLCAGEKERGTLETLLSSPAERSEIALGKLLTIMVFSMITAALNLASVGITGLVIFRQLAPVSAPPPLAVVWLGLALVPVSALFSALCLALAAFARSTKEGQYYLVPLLLATLPLAILPMARGVEINLGNSLIPVTNIVLLLGCLLTGEHWQALQFAPLVIGVTLIGCWLAVRWAVEQFNSESVLFRESEQFGLGLWLRHLVRDRQPTPTAVAALCCGVAILLLRFYLGSVLTQPAGFGGFVRLALLTQLVVIAAPALLMTIMFTRSPRQTLLLNLPARRTIPAAVLLAVAFHPVIMGMQSIVRTLYPVSDDLRQSLEGFQQMFGEAQWWQIVLVLGLVPALCEELAFRGFILSGFRRLGNDGRAIALSAVFFGLAHGILQQSILSCMVGLLIGYVAVQSRSILPGMIFHCLHNTLVLSTAHVTSELLDRWPALSRLVSVPRPGEIAYSWQVVVLGGLLTVVLLAWFTWRAQGKSPEEELQEAFQRVSGERRRKAQPWIAEW
jgi:sodium transport system permease protein